MVEQRKVFYIRRAIFALMGVAVAIPLIFGMRLPMTVSWPAQNLYDAVAKVPTDKIVIVSANWDAGTKGESDPQTTALIYQLAKSGKRFAIWGWTFPSGPELTQRIAEPIAKRFGRKYGVDWVNWGYTTGTDAMIRGWAENIVGTLKTDVKQQPLDRLPIMKHARSAKDIGIIVEIASSASVGSYIQWLNGVYGTPIGYACTGVMVSEAFPLLDSRQLIGMMRGLVGAAEYEQLAGHPAVALTRMSAQSFAHVLIIVLIIAGNAGYFMRKRTLDQDAGRGRTAQ